MSTTMDPTVYTEYVEACDDHRAEMAALRAELEVDALAAQFELGIPNFDAGPPTEAEWDAIADLESAGAFDEWASPQVTSW